MSKKFTKLSFISLILVLCFNPTFVFGANVSLDGLNVLYDENSGSPFIDGASRTQVPFRKTMETFGCEVSWDDAKRAAIASKSGIVVEAPIDMPYIIKNGIIIQNDTSAMIKNGRTYLPIRAVLEAFNADVTWDDSTQTVMAFSEEKVNELTVHFLDVGQADSIFIDYKNYEILIDGGRSEEGEKIVDYIKPYINGSLDLVIATHEHDDHIGGLPYVLKAFEVSQIIDNGRFAATPSFAQYYANLNVEPNCIYKKVTEAAFKIDENITFNVIPMDGNYQTPNENSIITSLEYNEVSLLLMGDLETTVEKNNLHKFSDIDVLKVGHHGSRTATCQDFIDIVNPEDSIISAGIDNKFLLPNADVIERLSSSDSKVYGTFRSGDIIMSTDGTNYSIDTETILVREDAGAPYLGNQSNNSNNASHVTEKEAVYVGNSETKKFHLMDCFAGSRIADRRAVYFKYRQDAIDESYVPCKICNP